MRKAIYPGTFDPPHKGHLDLIARGASLVDELIVAVAVNPEKRSVFSQEERVELLKSACGALRNVQVLPFDGLAVTLLQSVGARIILRGIRTFADFQAEGSMALMNRQLAGEAGGETIFVLPDPRYAHYSSRWVKEVASFGGDVRELLPDPIAARVAKRLQELARK